jgi:glycosyltransferase involved in cell wall biosynthesis
MKQLKVLMMHPHDIYSAKEPWTIRIVELASMLTRMGHTVKLVYFPLPERIRGIKKFQKIREFETIPLSRRSLHLIRNITLLDRHAAWADIVHVQKCFPNAALPALFWSFFKKKHLHYDWDDWEYMIYSQSAPSKLFGKYIDLMEKMMPRLADSISVSSEKLKAFAAKASPGKKIVKVPVGANIMRFDPSLDGSAIRKAYGLKQKVIMYLGQLNGAQYAGQIITAFRKIKEVHNDSSLFIVGGGSNLDELKELAKADSDIIFSGFLKDEDIPLCVAAADVCVAVFEKNRITECKSPLKIVEYMGSGKAIVASDVGEVRSMLGGAGIIIPPGNIDRLSDAVISLLSDDGLRVRLGKMARARAEKVFTWQHSAERLLEAYPLS